MRVIKKGRKQEGWSKQYVCTGFGNGGGGCGAKLLVSEFDLYETVTSFCGEMSSHSTFCCSECGVESDVTDHPPRLSGKRPSDKERKAIAQKFREEPA